MKQTIIITLLLSLLIHAAPHGTIQVMDNRLKRPMPLDNIEVSIRYAGGEAKTYTDSKGNFSFPESTPRGRYYLTFQDRQKHFYIAGDRDEKASMAGPNSHSPWNLTIPVQGENHYYATIFRAVRAYIRSDFVKGSSMFKNLKINAHYRKKVGKGKARFNAFTGEVSTWGINSNNDKPYNDIRLFGFMTHEMAHVHHDHFYQGRSQHLDTEPRLRESWAEAVKHFLVLEEYGEYGKNFREFKTYSKQIPFHSGWHNHNWGRSAKYYGVYTPLMIDLVDDYNQEAIDDRVSGYTMQQILAVMKEPECKDFDDLYRLLKTRYDNPTEQYLPILFREMEEKK